MRSEPNGPSEPAASDMPDDALRAAISALPREIMPPEDLWPSIQQELQQRLRRSAASSVSPREVPSEAMRPRRPWRARSLGVFVGLAAIVVVTIATAVMLNQRVSDRAEVATRVADAWQPTLQPWDVLPASTEPAELERYTRQLNTILEEESHSLRPETMATLRRNLAVIDKAVDEIKDELERDPQSAPLRQRLLHAYQQQAALVRLAWQAS